jgi:hypothetical protein
MVAKSFKAKAKLLWSKEAAKRFKSFNNLCPKISYKKKLVFATNTLPPRRLMPSFTGKAIAGSDIRAFQYVCRAFNIQPVFRLSPQGRPVGDTGKWIGAMGEASLTNLCFKKILTLFIKFEVLCHYDKGWK